MEYIIYRDVPYREESIRWNKLETGKNMVQMSELSRDGIQEGRKSEDFTD